MPPTPTDLARRIEPDAWGLPSRPVTEAALISQAFALAKDRGCNLIGAETTISYVPPGYSVVFRLVRFDPTAPKTWYKTDDGFALSFVALSQLAALAAVTWEQSDPMPVPRGSRYLWRHKAAGSMRMLDGTRRTVVAAAELDLRGETKDETGCTPGQLIKKRQKGAAHCESSAKARVIRQLLGIRTYSQEEQNRPFVVVTLAWIPPVGNAEVDKMIAAAELGIVSQVYGRPAQRALPAPTEVFDDIEGEEVEPEPVPVQAERQETRREPAPDRRDAPPPDDPWDPPAAPAPTGKPDHHPSWRGDQSAFFVQLTRLSTAWAVPEVKDYKVIADFCASIKRPRPSGMSQAQRQGLIGWLDTKPGRDAFETWLHTGSLPSAK